MNESRAARYQRRRRRVQALAALSVGGTLAAVALTPLGQVLADAARTFAAGLPAGAGEVVTLAAFVAVVGLLANLAALPAVIYRARRLDPAYARGDGVVEGVMLTQLKVAGLTLTGGWLAAVLVQGSVWLVGIWWWALAGLALASILAGLLRLGPLLLVGTSNVRSLSRPGLEGRLRDLARTVRVPVAGIDEWVGGGGATTALVTGIGRSRRVVLSADMIRHWSDDEIAVVVAHELAHHAHHDLRQALLLNVTILGGALALSDLAVRAFREPLGLAGAADPVALPLVALVVAATWAVTAPVRHAQSRRHERRADLCALRWTGGAEAFGTAVRRLSEQRLAEDRPSTLTRWLHHRHPSVAERLATAEAYARLDPADDTAQAS